MNIQFINQLLDMSADITMNYFNSSDLAVQDKADKTPVSIADKKTETAIRELIKQQYPDHGIIGEEFGTENSDSQYTWIIDPIDGTRAFINGGKTFANMVCLLKNGNPFLSGVGFPALNQRYVAGENKTYFNEIETTVSETTMADCELAYTGEYIFNENELSIVKKISSITAGEKVGGDAYNYCRMVAGDKIFVIESDLKPYDYLPLVPIVKNAGGFITDWNGNELTLESGNQVIATSFDNSELIGKIND